MDGFFVTVNTGKGEDSLVASAQKFKVVVTTMQLEATSLFAHVSEMRGFYSVAIGSTLFFAIHPQVYLCEAIITIINFIKFHYKVIM